MSVTLKDIQNCQLLLGFDDTEIEHLEPLFNQHEMGEGKTVFVENMASESLYLISQGAVAIFKMLAEGEEKTLAVLGAGDLFGELALFDSAPRAATARIAENATILSIKKSDFDKFCHENPVIAIKLLRNIVKTFCLRLRETDSDFRDRLQIALTEMP